MLVTQCVRLTQPAEPESLFLGIHTCLILTEPELTAFCSSFLREVTDYFWVITSPLPQLKSSCSQKLLQLVHQFLCLFRGRQALQMVVYVEASLDCLTDILPRQAVVDHILLQCVGCAARATGCPEREDLPLIDTGGIFSLQVSPQKTEKCLVLRQQSHLMEHPLYVATDGDRVFPEAQEDAEKCRAQGGSRQEKLVKVLTLVLERAVKNQPVLAIVLYEVIGNIPSFC